ncbi:MAG: glycosyltransferase [Chitinophagaceae bacterium]|nr:glycosyltransferase [Chitinophagaceae bacterium]
MLQKILYISYDGMTDPLGQSQVLPYLQGLAAQGYHFHILSAEKKQRLQNRGHKIKAMLNHAGIKWSYIPFTQTIPILSKVHDQWRLNQKALEIAKNEKPDLIHCRSYVAAEAGLLISKKLGIPFLFDMRGFWVDERVDSGQWNLKNPVYRYLYRIYKKKEKQFLQQAVHIVSLTYAGKNELIQNYQVPESKISVIPCCADPEHFNAVKYSNEIKKEVRKKLNIPFHSPVLSYLGSLGGWYLTDEMLDFFKVLLQYNPDSVFLFITHNSPEEILSKARSKGIPEEAIRIQPAHREEVPMYLSVSNWNIFFIKKAYSKIGSSPTKMGEVMASGIPVICNDIGDNTKIIRGEEAGIVVHQLNTESYEEAVRKLTNKIYDSEKIKYLAARFFNLHDGVNSYLKVYQSSIKS